MYSTLYLYNESGGVLTVVYVAYIVLVGNRVEYNTY